MTVTLFVSILTIGASLSVLLTEAIKKYYENAKKEYSSNVVALVNSVVVGGLGTAVVYMLIGIPWTVNNIVCIVCMVFAVWVGSMIGYDKIIQLLKQISDAKKGVTMAYTDKTFFATIKPFVIADMKTNRILASLTASQAFIESNKGNSGLTVKCNNLFGIKGKYNGQSGRFLTTEYYNGVKQRVYADFRKYPSWQESIADHSSLFNRLERYKNLRGEKNYVTACINVKNDGYATSPTYTKTLIDCIEKYKLYEWDSEVSGIVVQKTEILEYPTLKLGSHNEYVLAWQKYLNLSGFPCGLEDGIFGRNTLIAVKDYQESIGLVADGVIGLKTWKSIK